jgi:F0F1-type ATP synthase delta subunit
VKEVSLEKLFAIAGEQAGGLEKEMLSFSDLLSSCFELRTFLEDTSVPFGNKDKLFAALLPNVSDLFRSLAFLLIEQSLMPHFTALTRSYSRLVSQKTATQLLEVTSARELATSERARIQSFVKERVRFYFKRDAALLGGLRLHWEDGRFLDLTFSNSLEKLKETIIA